MLCVQSNAAYEQQQIAFLRNALATSQATYNFVSAHLCGPTTVHAWTYGSQVYFHIRLLVLGGTTIRGSETCTA